MMTTAETNTYTNSHGQLLCIYTCRVADGTIYWWREVNDGKEKKKKVEREREKENDVLVGPSKTEDEPIQRKGEKGEGSYT
ncbi:hypothetical protein, unlikely [Trypanosoma brucei gambiense DAL972]|uniref:Uncharacterized protein n=1 Tax=Trypanosoma brucei gambiense (strain MHOM/CI/86/DAL972) TaxID=679716 RepID=C9ZV13_TRYB9|nr:hypothetical protein, unlikely [Trypanosoma brucei gambiense DAL972]CBH13251.1 hypothetical protein, unlikely [Trypanosoma brucei gambiense DAL972]|eukprot:XP_011775528.1 hypothetical protein, unlikely [Trypanosoma brucei gambiense DAL972]